MIDLLPYAWISFLCGLLWLIDTSSDAIANLVKWLLYNLILRWLGRDNPARYQP